MIRLSGARFSERDLKSLNVAVVGARGYSGTELVRLLLHHEMVQSVLPVATGDFDMREVLPALRSPLSGVAVDSFLERSSNCDVAFLATPNETSIEIAPKLLERGITVVDLSGAFRLRNTATESTEQAYRSWYRIKNHSAVDWVQRAEYGLVPFVGGTSVAQLIANPGCFATAASLALIPLYRSELICRDRTVFIDAKSGTTGAGKKAEERLLFSEVADACLPYRVGDHQHQPEIAQSCAQFGFGHVDMTSQVRLEFVPHLLPVRRGIILSAYCHLKPQVTRKEVKSAFASCFEQHSDLIEVIDLNESADATRRLSLRTVVGSARTTVAFKALSDDRYVVFSLLDNLMKGAASQAIENFNRLCGLSTSHGLLQREALV